MSRHDYLRILQATIPMSSAFACKISCQKTKIKGLIKLILGSYYLHRDCCSKFATGLKCSNRHRSKSIWVTSLFFCQNDSPMSESFWQKNRLITHIPFDQCLFEHFSPVANFEQQSIETIQCTKDLYQVQETLK